MTNADIKILLLTGGRSSRMGSPKYLLPFPTRFSHIQKSEDAAKLELAQTSTIPLYIHLLHLLIATCGPAPVLVSVRTTEQEEDLKSRPCHIPFQIIRDESADVAVVPAMEGPAAGLLAAHEEFPTATFLVLACDFPLMTVDALRQLLDNRDALATCFVNEEGFLEPLAALWSAEALVELRRSVIEMGRTGPSWTLRRIGAKTITPEAPNCLHSANTPAEWSDAMVYLETMAEDTQTRKV